DELLAGHRVLVRLQLRPRRGQRVHQEQLFHVPLVLADGVEEPGVLSPDRAVAERARCRPWLEASEEEEVVIGAAVLRQLIGLLLLARVGDVQVVVLGEQYGLAVGRRRARGAGPRREAGPARLVQLLLLLAVLLLLLRLVLLL